MGMSSKARFHILAVDDSLIDRRLIERLLKTVSCQAEILTWMLNRCLEEGAEEFFLKPVRLSDMNRLRSHLAESKIKDELLHPQENGESQLLHQQPTNKRKAIDENLSPEKRPRYRGVPVV